MNREQFGQFMNALGKRTTLVAVSKLQSAAAIQKLYDYGQRDFGENYVQELAEKHLLLPDNIRWHFIGHLQSNKVKYIAPFVHLIQSVDSFKLLMEIDRQAKKVNRVIDCLLQVHIAAEDTKFGLSPEELQMLVEGVQASNQRGELLNIRVRGLMGMASFSDDVEKVRSEMKFLSALYDKYAQIHTPHLHFATLSMGMSGDYRMAIEEGSNMVRIGSLLFGQRPKYN